MKKNLASAAFIISIALLYVEIHFLLYKIPSNIKSINLYLNHSYIFLSDIIKFLAYFFTLIFVFLILWLKKKKIIDSLGIRTAKPKYILMAILIGILIGFFPFIKNISMFTKTNILSVLHIIDSKDFFIILKSTFLITIYRLVLYIPSLVLVELIFRGVILNELRGIFKVQTAIAIQAVLAGVLAYVLELNVYNSICIIIMSGILGIVCFASKSIWTSITINLTIVVLSSINQFIEQIFLLYIPTVYKPSDVINTFVKNRSLSRNQPELVSNPFYITLIIIAIIVIIIILWNMVKISKDEECIE